MTLRQIFISLFILVLFCSCAPESEKILREKIENEIFDFSNLKKNTPNIWYGKKGNIQYGLIKTESGELIKFWFLTHHETSDIGGTIYEYPSGEREFRGGLHCCEVQYYENGKLGKKFCDVEEFRMYVNERDGIKP